MAIADQLQFVQARIDKAALEAGQEQAKAQLVAVSKTRPVEDVVAALSSGQKVFGENRVQEAVQKFTDLKQRHADLELHLIGPLQSNKVKEAVRLFDVVQTVDRPKLAAALAKEMQVQQRFPRLFVQVNVGEEPQKSGVLPTELDDFLGLCREEHDLTVAGLMCIPPFDEEPAPFFLMLKQLARQYDVPLLSMGMSADFETAVQFGADYVRVGTAIFGARS